MCRKDSRKDSFMLHATTTGVNPFRSRAAVKQVFLRDGTRRPQTQTTISVFTKPATPSSHSYYAGRGRSAFVTCHLTHAPSHSKAKSLNSQPHNALVLFPFVSILKEGTRIIWKVHIWILLLSWIVTCDLWLNMIGYTTNVCHGCIKYGTRSKDKMLLR
jgi:hypothetical protein